MSIAVSNLSYHFSKGVPLFEHISFYVPPCGKVSVTGKNGSGKSTLLRLLAGQLIPSAGAVRCLSTPYLVPQQTHQAECTGQTVAEALGVDGKINALHAICGGSCDPLYFDLLADDWDVESRCRSALDDWALKDTELHTPMERLSGGEKTKVYLAGLLVHQPGIILLDEPTNHLDFAGRQKLCDCLATCKATVVAVSHDVTLLNQLETTFELSDKGLVLYGGNYAFYRTQKEAEDRALEQQIRSEETALRTARRKAAEVRERQEKRMSRAGKTTSGIPRILLNARQEKGENTVARLSGKQEDIIAENRRKLAELQQKQSRLCSLKIDVQDAALHRGKRLVTATCLNFGYTAGKRLWPTPLNLEIRSGERILIAGDNGTGKTTLVRLLTGELLPSEGNVRIADFSHLCLDQEYSLTKKNITVLELAEASNHNSLPDHEIKLRLNRALFPQDAWNKNCLTLSGGERMRLSLCCLMISNQIPDMLILDEPTNNLDAASLAILTDTVKHYHGTLLIISHDRHFTEQTGITQTIALKKNA
ncbi:MAG: ATP-binding cassette domain-containing protein [Tannerellaceae bacterium]|jgi:ATPase subunit of ABC transporter with duplicated ATPase domains|nr:ATP-binding cassette domain-containing protein [Tannerellaceae bacterium]